MRSRPQPALKHVYKTNKDGIQCLLPLSDEIIYNAKDAESEMCIRVERHVYLQTVVSVCLHDRNPTEHVGPVKSRHIHHIIVTCSLHNTAEHIAYLPLNYNHSL